MSLIETVDLCRRYGERYTLKNASIRVERGEVFALIGPTGAGKTTLLRLIDLLDTPTSGRIFFDGVDVTESGRLRFEVRRKMAFVLQKPVVFNMSVFDNIAYSLRWRAKKGHEIREKVNQVLETVALLQYKNQNARTLSGGEAQRVAIARAIAIEPEVLLLDEPTANLDPVSTAKIEELIALVASQHETAIVMATHNMAQGQRLADRIGVLINGELVQTGDPREVFELPGSREVAEFVGIENILDGVIASNQEGIAVVDIDGAHIEAVSNYAAGEKVSACLRAEDVTLSISKPVGSARNVLAGGVARVVFAGSLARIELDCGFTLVALVTRRSVEEMDMVIGDRVYASFKATGVHTVKRRGG